MNAMQVFNYEGNEVRTVMKDDEPWWVLADVCRVLGLSEPHRVARRLDDDEKDRTLSTTPGGKQSMTIINESGLYKVILRSDKPEAKKFTRWVTHEVLPTIRKTGSYGAPTADLAKLAEQMTQVATTMVMAVEKLTSLVDRLAERPVQESAMAQIAVTTPAVPSPEIIAFNQTGCKLETFPPDIVRKVEEMLTAMEEQQNLNFSMIARFCTINGYSITSPAVKTYYRRHFVAA